MEERVQTPCAQGFELSNRVEITNARKTGWLCKLELDCPLKSIPFRCGRTSG